MLQVALATEQCSLMHHDSRPINHGSTSVRHRHHPSTTTNEADGNHSQPVDKTTWGTGNNSLVILVVLFILLLLLYIVVFHLQDVQSLLSRSSQHNKPMTFGQDRDEHGCIGSAGYQWCAKLNRCVQPWETPCELSST